MKLEFNGAAGDERRDDPNRETNTDQSGALAQDQAQDILLLCPKRHADADFHRALADRKCDHAVDADRSERGEQVQRQPLRRELIRRKSSTVLMCSAGRFGSKTCISFDQRGRNSGGC
jgi:hypothetical protein